jgi:hypothetical protein
MDEIEDEKDIFKVCYDGEIVRVKMRIKITLRYTSTPCNFCKINHLLLTGTVSNIKRCTRVSTVVQVPVTLTFIFIASGQKI